MRKEYRQIMMNASDKDRGLNVNFERLRRITGYLVADSRRWNNAKKAELKDRVKHGISTKN